MATLRDTIKEITRKHLEENNGLLLGQAITAVGFVNGTVPDCRNIVELPMCDAAGAGIAVGAALSGRRPIFVVRYQDFITIGLSPIVNYAAKSKELFGKGTPIFIRLIADESVGAGPVHSGKLHGLFLQFPGLKVCAPITPLEYQYCWEEFMADDCPYIISEHRASFDNSEEMIDTCDISAKITLFGVSAARFNMYKAQQLLSAEGITCNTMNIRWLKPLNIPYITTEFGLVVDTGFENGGAAQHIAYKIMEESGTRVFALGLKDASVGCTPATVNQTPSAEKIVSKVKEILLTRSYRIE